MTWKGKPIKEEPVSYTHLGRNISIHAAEETNKEIHKKQVKKSGLIGGGLGLSLIHIYPSAFAIR